MTTDEYKELAITIPSGPGIYKFIAKDDEVLYVGKAKNLKNRVASYFGERKDRLAKTKAMVKKATRIEFTIVESEHDALLLECSLIKKYQPPFNVMLKDGKGYPYICIKNERFPRVFVTRRVFKDGSSYFGPYVNQKQVYVILELIKNLFPLRTCSLNLAPEPIRKSKYKVCLEYHIKNCKGPCEGYETEEQYMEKIAQIKHMLKGQFSNVKVHLKQQMTSFVEELEFEKAQDVKEKLDVFEDYQGKSTVVNPSINDIDVFSIVGDESEAYVNYLKIVNGAIIHTFTLEMTKNLDEDERDLLVYAILDLRERFESTSAEIILPFEVEIEDHRFQITVPKIGDKKKLLELSQKNAVLFHLQKRKEAINQQSRQTSAERILTTLKNDLQMTDLPMHIECFDNSNFHGSYPVSSCVVFKNAKPSKRDYRHFNVKTVEGPNDFATMEEVVYRRYKRILAEGQSLPQLILIDGGKGQLGAAVKSLSALGIQEKVTVVGIAKRLEEIFFPGDSVPLHINKKSESLKLIQQCRNEAHRFAITFHRNQRSKNFTTTALKNLPGVGDKIATKLLEHFGSVKVIANTSAAELQKVVGKVMAQKLYLHFNDSSLSMEQESDEKRMDE